MFEFTTPADMGVAGDGPRCGGVMLTRGWLETMTVSTGSDLDCVAEGEGRLETFGVGVDPGDEDSGEGVDERGRGAAVGGIGSTEGVAAEDELLSELFGRRDLWG